MTILCRYHRDFSSRGVWIDNTIAEITETEILLQIIIEEGMRAGVPHTPNIHPQLQQLVLVVSSLRGVWDGLYLLRGWDLEVSSVYSFKAFPETSRKVPYWIKAIEK